MKYNLGEIYQGNFNNGAPDGQGEMILQNGKKIEVNFVKG